MFEPICTKTKLIMIETIVEYIEGKILEVRYSNVKVGFCKNFNNDNDNKNVINSFTISYILILSGMNFDNNEKKSRSTDDTNIWEPKLYFNVISRINPTTTIVIIVLVLNDFSNEI